MTLVVKPVREVPRDVEFREEDQLFGLAHGIDLQTCLQEMIDSSLGAYTIEDENQVIAFWGYRPSSMVGESCYVWMAATPAYRFYSYRLLRISRGCINWLLGLYPVVFATADTSYSRAVVWLEWLGFKTYGTNGIFVQMKQERAL